MPALAISPSTAFATPTGAANARGRVNFSASGGTGPYTFSISSNRSGGSVDPTTGIYKAGPRGLVPDQVTVTDSLASTATALVSVTAGYFQQAQQNIGPPWMKLPNGRVIEGDYGAEKDWQFERLRQGLLAGFPGMGPYDALDLVAEERQLPRAASESPSDAGGANDQALAARLANVWEDTHGWSPAGCHASLLYALDRAGFPMGTATGANIVQRYRRYSYLTGSGGTPVYGVLPSVFDFSPLPPWFPNQFMIIFGADVPDLTPGSSLAAVLNSTVKKWKPAKADFYGTSIIISGPIWGWPPTQIWGTIGSGGSGLTWGGGSTRFVAP